MPLSKVDSGAANNVIASKKSKGKNSPTINDKSRTRKLKSLSPIIAFVGRVVVVRIRDGTSYIGVCVDPDANGKVKFQNVHKMPEIGFEEFVMPLDIVDNELLIPREDIIDMDVKIGPPSRRFATDGEYGGNSEEKNIDPNEFQEWNDDGAVFVEAETHGSGWSVDEMLKANEKLGVRSTYAEDMSQYTTCDPVGTEEERAHAEEVARQIERDARSKHMAFLENDDEERDLDKETNVDVGQDQSNKRFNRNQQRGGRGNNYRDGDNWRGPNRPANNNRGRQEFKSQRDRIKAAGGNEQRRNQNDDRGYQNNVSGNRKRTEDLRSWGNEFNNAYQSQSATPPAVETPQSISTSPTQQKTEPQQEKQPTPPPSQELSPKNDGTQVSESTEKKFQFNPNAKAFVPNAAKPFVPIVTMPPPPVTNYVIAQMPQTPNMVPAYIPHVPVGYPSQMNQNMQAPPPLIAQPGNMAMQNEMQPNYVPQQPSMVVPIPTNVPPPPIIPQNMPIQQQQQRNNGRKMQNNHQGPQRMMQQQINPTSFQNLMPQTVFQMAPVSLSGPNNMQFSQMPRAVGPGNQFVIFPSGMVPYFPRQEFHDPNMMSQPATPIPANQPASPPMNQMSMGIPQQVSQQKPPVTVNFVPNYSNNQQIRGITPLMGINNVPPQNQHMPHRKPVPRRRNE
uniref:LsmAD domain-containing protein n=1 Tax=Panagrolaimus sp. JU765 TaxID=591449 RepID=A0AC34RQ68_9BILA